MLMMFLQFFIWGAWWTTVGNYMRSHGMTDLIYVAYMSCPTGSIVAPFLFGAIADRFFPVQKVLGTMHLMSSAFLLAAPFLAENVGSPVLFNVALFAHMVCYMPTVGLATATSFHLLQNKEGEFPRVRMLGTIGWIVAGILVSKLLKSDATALPMYVSAAAGLLLGVYAFTLPHVPPRGAGKKFSVRDVFGIDALKELGSRPFYIFLGGVLLISVPAGTYFPYVPLFLRDSGVAAPDVPFRMTFGEMSEILFLLTLPWFLLRWGIKGVLLAGMSAWIVRYGLFSSWRGRYHDVDVDSRHLPARTLLRLRLRRRADLHRQEGIAGDSRAGAGAVRAHELRDRPAVRDLRRRPDLRARRHRSRRAGRSSAMADVLALPSRVRVRRRRALPVRLP